MAQFGWFGVRGFRGAGFRVLGFWAQFWVGGLWGVGVQGLGFLAKFDVEGLAHSFKDSARPRVSVQDSGRIYCLSCYWVLSTVHHFLSRGWSSYWYKIGVLRDSRCAVLSLQESQTPRISYACKGWCRV